MKHTKAQRHGEIHKEKLQSVLIILNIVKGLWPSLRKLERGKRW